MLADSVNRAPRGAGLAMTSCAVWGTPLHSSGRWWLDRVPPPPVIAGILGWGDTVKDSLEMGN